MIIAASAVVALAGLAGFVVLANQRNWTPFLEASQPVTADQLKATLVAENWTDIQINDTGNYLHAVGKRDGQVIWMTVDPKSGKRMFDDDVTY
jgi:hypothetical protein